jgi:hypothetical protein
VCEAPDHYHYFVLLRDGTVAVTLFPTPSLRKATTPMALIGAFVALAILNLDYRKPRRSKAEVGSKPQTD